MIKYVRTGQCPQCLSHLNYIVLILEEFHYPNIQDFVDFSNNAGCGKEGLLVLLQNKYIIFVTVVDNSRA